MANLTRWAGKSYVTAPPNSSPAGDSVAALGMRVLGNPYGNDPRIISGESGAVGLGVLAAVHYHPQRQSLMEKLALNKDAVVLVISTEGDTDVKHYREVVWEGKHAVAP